MKKKFSNQLKTYQSLMSLLDEHKAQWQGFQPMVEAIDEMNDLFQQSELLREVTGASTESVTILKNNIKKEVILKIRVLRNAIIAYAAKEDKPELIADMKNKSKHLKNSSRETSLYDVCKYIYNKALLLKNELLDYKIEQTLLDLTGKQIDKFKASISTPVSMIRNKKLSNENLKKIHLKINSLLIYRLDKLMTVMGMDNPELAAKYFVLRPFPKTRTKKNSEEIGNKS